MSKTHKSLRKLFPNVQLLSTKQIACKLLEVELKHNQLLNRIDNAIGGCVTDRLRVDLLSIVLDMFGVPPDNTVETVTMGSCSEWPDDAFCRDWLIDKWLDVEQGESTMTVSEYIEWVKAQTKEIASRS
jgi:hypothetical protein